MFFNTGGMGFFPAAGGTGLNTVAQQQTSLDQMLLWLTQQTNSDDDVTLSVITDFVDIAGSDTLTFTENSFTVTGHTGTYTYNNTPAKWGLAQWG